MPQPTQSAPDVTVGYALEKKSSRPFMTITSRPQSGSSELIHVVTHGSERFSVAFRGVDPVVHIRGIALMWEAIVRLPDGRAFHGYGAVHEDALYNACASATSSGTLTHVDTALVTAAVCRVPSPRPVLS
jgi:hypothetical protein